MTAGVSRDEQLPRVSLGTWPTPAEPAPRLAAALGLRPGDRGPAPQTCPNRAVTSCRARCNWWH
jgi:hypothetical protein